ncbi:hypothetical protein BV210_09435 [Halorientalis sp. IM1011]|uniref:hypothetical protein n=1 Tax=Halorientalis sp. IM1011 TaxID=1932360 RepID=UPI00097CC38D|nr:hypothetical protein [Halorientalis sp. IM1011]AQL42923.1 hypothetical protein BV210_09435 [Halorientalis sp. IM1011]
MVETYDAAGWAEALARVRQVGHENRVVVSKTVEPGLPDSVEVRPSNFPWSIHGGAVRVYREDSPGEHVQIKEFRDRWEVSLDRVNPHYQPLGHARNDVPVASLVSLPLFAATQSVSLVGALASTTVEKQGSLVNDRLVPLAGKVLI